MDNVKIGELIRKERKKRSLTQIQLAQMLHISDKTVSKWERGLGCPDISLLEALSRALDIDMHALLCSEPRPCSRPTNMKKAKLYICPECGNLSISMAEASVSCCGHRLKALVPFKAAGKDRLSVEIIENDYFISSPHEMTREHHITFIAFVTADSILLKKQYPEWDLQVRIPYFAHGRLLWHCSMHGAFYQDI